MSYNQYQQLLEALAKIVCHTHTRQKEFINNFRFALAHTAKEQFPKCSISELSHKTGLARATLSELLKLDKPIKTLNRDSVLLNELWRMRDSNNKVQIKGEYSYYRVAQMVLNSAYSPDVALKAFAEMKVIELSQDNKNITIKKNRIATPEDIEKLTTQLGKELKKMVDVAFKKI